MTIKTSSQPSLEGPLSFCLSHSEPRFREKPGSCGGMTVGLSTHRTSHWRDAAEVTWLDFILWILRVQRIYKSRENPVRELGKSYRRAGLQTNSCQTTLCTEWKLTLAPQDLGPETEASHCPLRSNSGLSFLRDSHQWRHHDTWTWWLSSTLCPHLPPDWHTPVISVKTSTSD